MCPNTLRRAVLGALSCLAVLAGGMAGSARAAQPKDCPLWFPDLQCDRHGRYEGFVAPLASPYLFEDPFITTGVMADVLWHDFPDSSVLQGGEAWVVAVQARVAITDRLAFIATKDGFAWLSPNQPLLNDQKGFMDIAAGLKYALIDLPEQGFILSPSLRFDLPTGSGDVFSGNGDGVWIPALSAAWGPGDVHWIGDFGARLPFDGGSESSSIFYHLHLDWAASPLFVPMVELSGYHWVDSGDGDDTIRLANGARVSLDTVQAVVGTGNFEGVDVLNLGSEGVRGNDILTLSLGFRVPLGARASLGMAYEYPISHRNDIFNQRATLSLLYEF